MSPSMNGGWEDEPETEREELAAWESQADGWRGDLHEDQSEAGWPEDQAGCEYWLYKGLDREDEDDGA